jgi:hypothetical protein
VCVVIIVCGIIKRRIYATNVFYLLYIGVLVIVEDLDSTYRKVETRSEFSSGVYPESVPSLWFKFICSKEQKDRQELSWL